MCAVRLVDSNHPGACLCAQPATGLTPGGGCVLAPCDNLPTPQSSISSMVQLASWIAVSSSRWRLATSFARSLRSGTETADRNFSSVLICLAGCDAPDAASATEDSSE